MTLVAYAYQSIQKKALEERKKESPWPSGMREHLNSMLIQILDFCFGILQYTNAFKVGFPDK